MSEFHNLKVKKVEPVTSDSVAVSFDVPAELQDTFTFKPGQFLTLRFDLQGQDVRRSYSLCNSAVSNEAPRVGVKRVKNGLVSNHINSNLKAGDEVQVMAPDGRFCAELNADHKKTYYLFAAGSGITPILSVLRSVLQVESNSVVNLFYGNRNQESVMFKDEIADLQNQYGVRLNYEQCLSKPKGGGIGGLFKKKQAADHRKGRIDREAVKWFVEKYPANNGETEYYICGPGSMIENTQSALKSLGIAEDKILFESFGTATEGEAQGAVEGANLTAHLNGQTYQIVVPKGKTLLRALIDEGIEPPYSCEGGVCSTCACQLKKGSVDMINNIALDDSEIAAGQRLSCQSVATSSEIEIDYD